MKKALLILILCFVSLMGCSPSKQIVRTEYIKTEIPPIPADPVYYRVTWQAENGRYCLTEEGAKNLLKNMGLMKSYQKDMKSILMELKQEK